MAAAIKFSLASGVRNAECADSVGRQGDLHHQQVIGDQERRGDDSAHEAAESEPGQQTEDADDIEHVVDVEAVPRPFMLPDAGDGSIEAVAEPLDHECYAHTPQPHGVAIAEHVRDGYR